MNEFFISIVLGVIEGITEFLPISSSGHLIIVNQFFDFTGPFATLFNIVIQMGAILSVVLYFWNRLWPFGTHKNIEDKKSIWSVWMKTIVGVFPALLMGVLFGADIKEYLFNPITVSIALIIGGALLIYLEKHDMHESITTMQELTYKTAFIIGIIQCIAMIPGTSRSAATIIGAMFLGTSRIVAAEFSFFLAIPTLFAASAYSLFKYKSTLSIHQIAVLGTGFIVSFIVALLVIAGFMRFISKNNFIPFGIYRIALGAVLLLYFIFIK